MKKLSILFTVLCLAGWITSCNNGENAAKSTESTAETSSAIETAPGEPARGQPAVKTDEHSLRFVVLAANTIMAATALGELAHVKAVVVRVRVVGETLAAGHTKKGNELKALAARKYISLPSVLSAADQKMIAALNTRTGLDFDLEFLAVAINSQEKALENLKAASGSMNDPEFGAYAERMMAMLETFLVEARGVREALKPES